METNTVQGDAVMIDELAQRVRAAQLPPPAERVRIRHAARLTLREVARTLRVSPMTVSRWEAGTVAPRLDQAVRYARLLAEVQAASTEMPDELSA